MGCVNDLIAFGTALCLIGSWVLGILTVGTHKPHAQFDDFEFCLFMLGIVLPPLSLAIMLNKGDEELKE